MCNTEIYTCEELQSGDSRITWNDSLRDEFRRSLIARLTDLNYVVSHIDACDRNSINSSVENFAEILNDVAKPLFSRQNVCKKPNSSNAFSNRVSKKADWFDDECRAAKQLYFNALNEFNRYKTDDNRLNMCTLKASYKAIVRKKKRKFEYFKIKEIELLRHAKPKDFWKLFKKNKKNNSKITLNEFFDYFSKMQQDLATVLDEESEEFVKNNNASSVDENNFEELDKPITVFEIETVIRSLKRNKSAAGDQLLNEYFIESADILSGHLVDLFNAILNSGFFPSQWSEGIIVPLFKKNDPNDVNNYRGITLVSCFSKIFTGILNNRLKNWAENNSIISDSQFGFRKGRSTTDACFVLNAIIQKILNEKGRLYCAFIDFKKAFDSV